MLRLCIRHLLAGGRAAARAGRAAGVLQHAADALQIRQRRAEHALPRDAAEVGRAGHRQRQLGRLAAWEVVLLQDRVRAQHRAAAIGDQQRRRILPRAQEGCTLGSRVSSCTPSKLCKLLRAEHSATAIGDHPAPSHPAQSTGRLYSRF